MKIGISIVLIMGILFSLRTRLKMMRWRSPQPSGALAKAITQLVGTAGGLYLSLELLLTFLGIPETVYNPPIYYVKPLAVFSLGIAIFQPYGQKIIADLNKRRG